MLTLRRCVVGLVAVLLVSGGALVGLVAVLLVSGGALAQTPTAPKESAEVAAIRVKANAGDAQAQSTLGMSYLGRGVPQDYAQAASWFRKAAEQGLADAQSILGSMSERGWGVPQDYAEAASWFRKAAEQGLADAQNILGSMSERGWGVPQDFVEAHKWLNLAASRASAAYQRTYAETRDAVAKLMTPAQIAEAQRRASEWLAAFEQRGGT